MVPANHQQGLGCITKCFDEEGRFRALDPGSTFGNVCGMDHFPKDASMCTFWCAVAVGALAKGTPIDSVSGSTLHRTSWVVVANRMELDCLFPSVV